MSVSIIKNILEQRNQTLSVAESCTGGGLAHEITSLAGISTVFLGGVITYSNDAKQKLLHIDADILRTKGAVSQEVAQAMAANCQRIFGSTWALSTTGIAGPTGGSLDKPVGLVWIGLAGPGFISAQQFVFSHISRLEHRQKTIEQALQMLKKQTDMAPQNR